MKAIAAKSVYACSIVDPRFPHTSDESAQMLYILQIYEIQNVIKT